MSMQNNIRALLSILFVGIAFFVFGQYTILFICCIRNNILLFLYIPSYFFDKLSYPGGVGEYIAEFFNSVLLLSLSWSFDCGFIARRNTEAYVQDYAENAKELY